MFIINKFFPILSTSVILIVSTATKMRVDLIVKVAEANIKHYIGDAIVGPELSATH